MAYFTYDTSVMISRKLFDLRIRTKGLVLSSVALLELIASAVDDSQRKVLEEMFIKYGGDNALIVPTEADWLYASKILYWLTHRRRRVDGGRLRQLAPGVSQRMALDALIAVSARRWKAAVVTENWDHFKAIQYFCGVKLIKASDFFR
jgi:predicted nucleic acid-binding protein